MIEVAFFQESPKNCCKADSTLSDKVLFIGFEASGHAGYDAYGRDIVCAAVSAILQTALEGIQKVVGVQPRVYRRDRKGYLQVQLPLSLPEAQLHDASLLIRTAHSGLLCIAEQYPDCVRLNVRTKRPNNK